MLLVGRKARRIASLEDKMENVQRLSEKLLSLRVDVVDIARKKEQLVDFQDLIRVRVKRGRKNREKFLNENSS